jgi:uncharacterized membrane protein
LPELFAVVYPDVYRAGIAVEEVGRCTKELMIDPDGVSTVICEHDGNCELTTSRRPDATADWSRFWGSLLGTILDGGERPAIDRRFRATLRSLLRPGTSALLIVLPVSARGRAREMLRPFGGTVLNCELGARALWSTIQTGSTSPGFHDPSM